MKKTTILGVLLTLSMTLTAQEAGKKRWIAGFSIGPSFANLQNSKAPHEGIFGFENVSIQYDAIEAFTQNPAYEVSILGQIRTGFSAGLQLEYIFNNGWSVQSAFSDESKGIYYHRSTSTTKYAPSGQATQISLQDKAKIRNNYITTTLSLRKYLFKKRYFFVDLGAYGGYLASSSFFKEQHHTENSSSGNNTTSNLKYTYKDAKFEYTNKLDWGLSTGIGLTKNITSRFIFKGELRANVGLRRLDSKYNNEFSVTPVPGANGYYYVVHSTNYYGFNSNARNINLVCMLGLGYVLGR